MATMKELAAEYREASARLAMRIAELEAAGVPPRDKRLTALTTMLRQTREIQRLLDGYYEFPRRETIAAVGWRTRRWCKDDN